LIPAAFCCCLQFWSMMMSCCPDQIWVWVQRFPHHHRFNWCWAHVPGTFQTQGERHHPKHAPRVMQYSWNKMMMDFVIGSEICTSL
jgi:hypothetical protein